jgi:hypothetical protein
MDPLIVTVYLLVFSIFVIGYTLNFYINKFKKEISDIQSKINKNG